MAFRTVGLCATGLVCGSLALQGCNRAPPGGSGFDASSDSGAPDAGGNDAGVNDGGAQDGGGADAGGLDGGDAGALLPCLGTGWRRIPPDGGIPVGAIRFDDWTPASLRSGDLSPPQWHYRLPFYAQVLPDGGALINEATQEVMDQEIAYAASAGLSFWALDWHGDPPPPGDGGYRMGYGLPLLLSSACKGEINFSLILLLGSNNVKPDGGVGAITAANWPSYADQMVAHFQQPNYQTVAKDRPLLFIFNPDPAVGLFGSSDPNPYAASEGAFAYLRAAAADAGLKAPYVVAMTQAAVAQSLIDNIDGGFDAVGAYTAVGPGGAEQELPYSSLVAGNLQYWNDAAYNSTTMRHYRVLPPINSGWDYRPELAPGDPPTLDATTPWYDWATPVEIKQHFLDALAWAAANKSTAHPEALLWYAWNESSEGGWLVPTLDGGTARLDAIHKVLAP